MAAKSVFFFIRKGHMSVDHGFALETAIYIKAKLKDASFYTAYKTYRAGL